MWRTCMSDKRLSQDCLEELLLNYFGVKYCLNKFYDYSSKRFNLTEMTKVAKMEILHCNKELSTLSTDELFNYLLGCFYRVNDEVTLESIAEFSGKIYEKEDASIVRIAKTSRYLRLLDQFSRDCGFQVEADFRTYSSTLPTSN